MWGDKLRIVETSAKSALEALKATQAKKKKGSEIYQKAVEINPTLSQQVTEQVFKTYLSNLSNEPESNIAKDVGSHGYYLKEKALAQEVVAPTQEPVFDSLRAKRTEKEKLLYPILQAWLQSKGYRTNDTSLMKEMGRWGNPDITGIMVDETLGAYEIEVVTIEAKISADNFRYDFFESVSHKRFTNRVYFSFASTANFLAQSNEELRYYSEIFKVGVIVVVIEEPHYKKFIDGDLKEIDSDLVDVYELFSAPYEFRQKRWQKEFLNALKITDTKTLWSWGE